MMYEGRNSGVDAASLSVLSRDDVEGYEAMEEAKYSGRDDVGDLERLKHRSAKNYLNPQDKDGNTAHR